MRDKCPLRSLYCSSLEPLVDAFIAVPGRWGRFFRSDGRFYCLLFTSVAHRLWIANQKEIYTKEQLVELQQLSDTRWSFGVSSCKALLSRIGNIVSLYRETKGQRNVFHDNVYAFHVLIMTFSGMFS